MPTVDPIRRAELNAAAEALVDWVRERRALWADQALTDDDAIDDDAGAPLASDIAAPRFPPPQTLATHAVAPHIAEPPTVPARSIAPPPTPVVTRELSDAPAEHAVLPAEFTQRLDAVADPPFTLPDPPVEPQQTAADVDTPFADGQMPVHPPANAAAQWYAAPAVEESTYAIEQADFAASVAEQPSSTRAASGPGFASRLFARDGALFKWGPRAAAAAAIVAAVAWGISHFGSRVKSSVGQLQSSVSDLKSSVSELKSSVTEMAGQRDVASSKSSDAKNANEAKTSASADAGTAAANGRGRGAPSPKTGRLTVESDPVGARVSVDGKSRGPTPLTLGDLAAGSHVVVIDSDKGSVRRSVKITAGATTSLSESIFAGFVKVLAPYEVTVAENNRALTLDERGQALLSPGVHELRFINRQLGYNESRRVEIEPGKIATVSLGTGSSKLAVTSSEPADVIVDGERVGQTPLSGQSIALGTHDIVVRGGSGERRFTMTVTSKPVRIDVDFSKP